MHALHGRDFADGGEASWSVRSPQPAPAPPPAAWESSRYRGGRPNLVTIAAIAAVHAALLALLVTFDVVPIHRPAAKPLVIELLPDIAPPPAAAAPAKAAEPPLLVPPPEVRVEAAPPPAPAAVAPTPPVATSPVVANVPVVTPAAEAAPAEPATPPDFTASYLRNPPPTYPIAARRAKEQGTARIKVLVNADGGIDQIKLAASSGSERLDEAALEAVRRWRFAPARQAGEAVAAWVVVPVPFVLKG